MKEKFLCDLGNNIRRHREAQHLSQEKLAELAETELNSISRYELGYCEPKISSLARIARALNVSLDDIVP
jgi:transcriptional regulator with XRE-family HTH domain